ncbi:MFS transporter [Exilibacterium tricleocarpae]|nr:MFS transporter [Exilibacterium tricleocarpae]
MKLIYSMGNLGIAIVTVMHMFYLVYFFFPPKDAGIPYLIPQTSLFMGLTLLGLIMALSRLTDAFLDPVIANFSDRLNHRLGKRIPMMRWAALPFSLCYLLVFFVPVSDGVSIINVIWLVGFLLLSAVFFTSYMIPFYSLMVDIAKTSHDKVDLGTISSAFWFAGFLFVSFTPSLWSVVGETFDVERVWAIRITFAFVAVVGLTFLMVPALLIDERKYADTSVVRVQHKVLPSLKRVMKNRSFRYYLAGNTAYTMATSMFEVGLIYYITVLAMQDPGFQGPLTMIIGALTLACYPLINKMAKGRGKSYVLKLSLFLFSMTFLVISTFGAVDVNIYILFGLTVLLSPFAQAAFGILPHVMTSDCAAYDAYKTGENRAGMYIGINGFFAKLGGSLGMIMFTSLLLFGKDVGDDMGIRFATLFGAGIAIVGLLFLLRYNEEEILSYTEAHKKQP